MPGTFTDVIELLIPELQRRGIFWNDYAVPGGTYRENLTETKGQSEPRQDHPAAAMIWRAHESEAVQRQSEQAEQADEKLDPVAMQFC